MNEVNNEVKEGNALITYVTVNNDGFATFEDGGSMYIPPNVSKASVIVPGEYRKVKVVQNVKENKEKTPWMCVFVEPLDSKKSISLKQSHDITDYKKKVLEVLEEYEFGYMSTSEVASEIEKDTQFTRNILGALFHSNRISMADVYSKPNQKRSSFTLWALSAEDFVNK